MLCSSFGLGSMHILVSGDIIKSGTILEYLISTEKPISTISSANFSVLVEKEMENKQIIFFGFEWFMRWVDIDIKKTYRELQQLSFMSVDLGKSNVWQYSVVFILEANKYAACSSKEWYVHVNYVQGRTVRDAQFCAAPKILACFLQGIKLNKTPVWVLIY